MTERQKNDVNRVKSEEHMITCHKYKKQTRNITVNIALDNVCVSYSYRLHRQTACIQTWN